MPQSIKLQFKPVQSPELKTNYKTALALTNLKLALIGCHQKTVTGAVRGSPILDQNYTVRFWKEPFNDRFSVAIQVRKPRHDGSFFMASLHESIGCFTKETKDDRDFFIAWLHEQIEYLRGGAQKPFRYEGGTYVWGNGLEKIIQDGLFSSSEEEVTPNEFLVRKEVLALYLEAVAASVRKLEYSNEKYQGIPESGEPREYLDHNVLEL